MQIHLEIVAALGSFPALLSLLRMNRRRLPSLTLDAHLDTCDSNEELSQGNLGAPNSDLPVGITGIYEGLF